MHFTGTSTSLSKLIRNNCPNTPWHSYRTINYWKHITASLSIPSNWSISLGNWKIIVSPAWPNWKYGRNKCGFRCKSSRPQSEHGFPRKTPNALCPCRPHYLCTAPFANCKFWSPQPRMLCKKSYPIQSKTAFPNKKQSLLLDNNEKRNSSLGNVNLKSDFPTNHTQLVSNAMFLSDYGIPADFHQFQFCDFLHLPNKESKQNPLTILYGLKVTKGKVFPP